MSDATTAPATLARLEGDWTITRRISNGARMAGHASFTPDDAGLAYEECGELRLADGQVFQATRAYRFEARPNGFAVFFAGRDTYLFHEIALRREGEHMVGEGIHPCQDDIYRSRYVFKPDGTFTITHVVKGPRHDYTMETVYRRR